MPDVDLGPATAVPTDRCIAVADGRAVALRVDDQVLAFQPHCLHRASSLGEGRVVDGKLQCPLHFWRYQLPDGLHTGGRGRLARYPVRIEDGHAIAELPEPPPPTSLREQLLAHAAEWDRAAPRDGARQPRGDGAGQGRPSPAAEGHGTTDGCARTPADTIVWDMGGVFRVYYTESLAEHGRAAGWPTQQLPLGPTGDAPDPDYQAMLTGGLHEKAYLARVMDALGGAGIDFDPLAQPSSFYPDREATWKLLHEVAGRDDRRQAILTNDASTWLGERWWETWPHRDLFDVLLDSTMIGVRKPAPEPFLEVLRRLGDPDPATCVFVDDMPVNVRAAEAVGMRGVLFDITDPDRSVQDVRRVVGL